MTNRPAVAKWRRFQLESLEQRQLLSANPLAVLLPAPDWLNAGHLDESPPAIAKHEFESDDAVNHDLSAAIGANEAGTNVGSCFDVKH